MLPAQSRFRRNSRNQDTKSFGSRNTCTKIVSSVDGYMRVYTRRNTRMYIYKKIWSGFLLRGITYFPTYVNFVLEIQATPGLRIVPGCCPVLSPRIQLV